MTRLLQLSARCHGDGAPYKAAAGVGLARRARAAPSPSLAGARRPRHGGRGLSSVLARASSRPRLGARGVGGEGGRGSGEGDRVPAAAAWPGDGSGRPRARGPRAPRIAQPAPEVSAPERRGARRADKTPLKGSASGCGWDRGLRLFATWRCHEARRARTTRDSRRIRVPAMPERESTVPRFFAEGQWEGVRRRPEPGSRAISKGSIWPKRLAVDPFLNQLRSLAWLGGFLF